MTITIPRAVIDWCLFLIAITAGSWLFKGIGLPHDFTALMFGMAWGWWITKRGIW